MFHPTSVRWLPGPPGPRGDLPACHHAVVDDGPTMSATKITRRALFGALGACSLAACHAPGQDPSPSPSPGGSTPAPSASGSPAEVPGGASLELWADDSRYPSDWTAALSRLAAQQAPPLQVQVNTTNQLAASLLERFAAGDPPAVVANGGSDQLGVGLLAEQLADLSPILTSTTPDGAMLGRVLRPGTTDAGMVGGVLRQLPYLFTVHGLWYSSSLFEQHHWSAPSTWPELLALGEKAAREEIHLFCWGRETATAYLRMCLASAVKQGGDEVRRALDQLEPKAWSQPEVQSSLKAMHEAVRAGHVKPGGSQRSWASALPAWTQDRSVLMVSSGSWLTAQAAPAPDFGLSLVPDPSVDATPALGHSALHAMPEENYLVARQSDDPAAGRALVLDAFDRSAALRFAQTNQVIPTRTDALPPAPGPVLTHQLALVKAAGKAVFGWRFIDHHGTNHDHQALWNAFLEGRMDVATLTRESQRISDLVASDPQQSRYPVR